MATKTEQLLSSVKFNKLTKAQYDAAILAGQISPTEFYFVEENDTPNYATAAQGAKADTAVQPAELIAANVSIIDAGNYFTSPKVESALQEIAAYLPPTGAILTYAGAIAPTGWLLCDGATISRIGYSKLFAFLGTIYGAGDGSTTFALPDMRGRVGVGIGGSGVTTLGQTGGEQTHVLTVAEMPKHDHWQNNSSSGGSESHAIINNGGVLIWSTTAASANENLKTYETGGNGAHNNMQPYVGINYIIKT